MSKQTNRRVIQGALLLSFASFIAKILSAVYRVPFQNLVGNTGFYVYQQVYPIYGIGMTFALSGFPVFLSNMIAEQRKGRQLPVLLKKSAIIIGTIGGFSFLFLYIFSRQIAHLMGDEGLTPIIRMVSWMYLLMPGLVLIRGYFQGTFRMIPTAVSQVIEQLVRVGVILFAAYSFAKTGGSFYQMGTLAMSSASIAALAALFILLIFLAKALKTKDSEDQVLWLDAKEHRHTHYQWRVLIRRFILEGGTICLISSMLLLYQLIDSFSLYKELVISGVSSEMAKNLKGIYDRAQPLVQLGMVVGVGFASSYMPVLTKSFAEQSKTEFLRASRSLIRMAAIFSLMATVGIIVILPRLNHVLFGDSEGSLVLAVYSLSVFLASMILAFHGILQSINRYHYTLFGLAVGVICKFVFNHLFVQIFGTLGASLATVVGLWTMFIIMLLLAPFILQGVLLEKKFILYLLGAASSVVIAVMIMEGLVVLVGGGAAFTRIEDFLIVMGEVGLGVFCFVVYALKTPLFTIREWLSLPKGHELLKLSQKIKKEKNV